MKLIKSRLRKVNNYIYTVISDLGEEIKMTL